MVHRRLYKCPLSYFFDIFLKVEKPMISHGRPDGHDFCVIHSFNFIKNFFKFVTSMTLATWPEVIFGLLDKI
jgi:hypothetical protein